VDNKAEKDREKMAYDMEDLRLDLVDVENKAEWRRRTRVADLHPRIQNSLKKTDR